MSGDRSGCVQVSDHAVVQYLRRFKGVDIEAVKAEIASKVTKPAEYARFWATHLRRFDQMTETRHHRVQSEALVSNMKAEAVSSATSLGRAELATGPETRCLRRTCRRPVGGIASQSGKKSCRASGNRSGTRVSFESSNHQESDL